MEISNEKKYKNIPIAEGGLLALASASAYMFAFLYECGHAMHFGIPIGLIRVSVETILIFGSMTIGLIIILFPFVNTIRLLMPTKLHPEIIVRIYPAIFTLLIAVVAIFLYGLSNWKFWIFYLILAALNIFVFFLLPIFTHRKVKGYLNKLIVQGDIDDHSPGLINYAAKNFGKSFVFDLPPIYRTLS